MSLPNDVLLLVGEQLDRQADRWRLMLVSRRFHGLFLPLVYRSATLENWHNTQSFVRAILTRPALARAVRQLNMSGWRSREGPYRERTEICPAVHHWPKVVSHSNEERVEWAEGLERGLGDAWIAFLLPLLNQLRELHLAYATRMPFLGRIMHRAVHAEPPFSALPAFPYLSDVSLNRRGETDNPHLSGEELQPPTMLLLLFFQLQSVRSITADSVWETNSIPEEAKKPLAGFSSITSIDLRASNGNYGMETLVASCAHLRSFKYQHSDSHLVSDGYQPSKFYRSLTESKRTLQTLWLDYYGDHYPFTAAGLNQTHDEWFGSLANFHALRELRVRLPNLLDIRYHSEPTTPLINCLPPSLETLYIESCEKRHLGMLVSQLQTLIKHRRARVPRLLLVDVEGAFQCAPPDDSSYTEFSALEARDNSIMEKVLQATEPLHIDCAHAGIELHIHDRALVHR